MSVGSFANMDPTFHAVILYMIKDDPYTLFLDNRSIKTIIMVSCSMCRDQVHCDSKAA